MTARLPEYRGAYDRLFLPPALIIGLGRWGAHVCDRFFKQMQSSLQLSRTRIPPVGSPERLRDCFARVACVRASDRERLPLEWAQHIETWPEEVETEGEVLFSDIDEDLVTTRIWQVP
jgi:hypothetical protein